MMTNPRKCLICDDTPQSRGLCAKHYAQFTRQRAKLPLDQWAEFEDMLIEREQLSPQSEDVVKPDNPFNQALLEFKRNRKQNRQSFAEEIDKLNEQMADETKEIRKPKSQKPSVQRRDKKRGKSNGTD
jgi:hypothetical protein